MKTAILILQNLIRIIGLILLALGFSFWGGRALEFIPLHMRLGEILVVLLWILAWLSIRRGVKQSVAIMVMIYGLFVFLFATNMGRFLPGRAHEAIRVLHFLFGVIAIGLAEMLGGRMKRRSLA